MPTWLKSRLGKSVAAGTLSVALVGGAAFAVAGPLMGSTVSSTAAPASSAAVQTASGNSTSSGQTPASASAPASAPASAKGRAGLIRRLLLRSVHASLVVKVKGGTYVTLTLDRGTIQSISSTSITILRPDGVSITAPLSSTTKFLRASESALATGDKVAIVQESGTTRDVVALGKAASKSHSASKSTGASGSNGAAKTNGASGSNGAATSSIGLSTT